LQILVIKKAKEQFIGFNTKMQHHLLFYCAAGCKIKTNNVLEDSSPIVLPRAVLSHGW